MKVLNLDSLIAVTKSVTIKGVDHAVTEMSVDDFIAANQEAKRIAEYKATPGDEDRTIEELNSSVRLLHRVLPSLTESELRSLTFVQLNALMDFVNGILEEEVGNAAPAAAAPAVGGEEAKK